MKILEYQKNKLCKLLVYLKQHNAYYKNIMKDVADINYNNIENIYCLLPLLKKQTIINSIDLYYDKSFTNNYNSDELVKLLMRTDDLTENHDKKLNKNGMTWTLETTSGTTGTPLPIVKNYNEKLIEARYLNVCRYRMSNKYTINNGMFLVHKTDKVLKSIDYRGNNSKGFDKLYRYIKMKNPHWIFSTTLILNQFVNFLINHKYDMSGIDLNFIETTSQKLYEDDKAQIRKVFNCAFSNNYGCREVWNIAYSCRCNKLHINTSNLIVDLVDDKGEIINDENSVGNIIITSMSSKTTPFVKYLIGDRGKISYKKCDCGWDTPILELCDGRNVEKLIGTDYYGNVIFRKVLRTVNFHNGVKDIKKIKIVQTSLNNINIYVKKDNKYDRFFEQKFKENFELQIGVSGQYKLNYIYDYPFFDHNSIKDTIFLNYI